MLAPVKTFFLSFVSVNVLNDSSILFRIKDELCDTFNYRLSDFTVRHFILDCKDLNGCWKYDVIAFVQLKGDYDE